MPSTPAGFCGLLPYVRGQPGARAPGTGIDGGEKNGEGNDKPRPMVSRDSCEGLLCWIMVAKREDLTTRELQHRLRIGARGKTEAIAAVERGFRGTAGLPGPLLGRANAQLTIRGRICDNRVRYYRGCAVPDGWRRVWRHVPRNGPRRSVPPRTEGAKTEQREGRIIR